MASSSEESSSDSTTANESDESEPLLEPLPEPSRSRRNELEVEVVSSSETTSETDEDSEVLDNVFAAPWKKSDVIFVVDGIELHVHRATLVLQSPVFEAMLDGHFAEASQSRIKLVDKSARDMVNFLKLLYPANLFSSSSSLLEENIIRMLELADEYQADAVMNQCLSEAPLTSNFVLKVLPFACKYNTRIKKACVDVCQRTVANKAIKKSLSSLDNTVAHEIYTGKCELLEKTLQKASVYLMNSMKDFLKRGKKSLPSDGRYNCGLSHEVTVLDFHKARNCRACVKVYKNKICRPFAQSVITSRSDGEELLGMLSDLDDILSQRSVLTAANLARK